MTFPRILLIALLTCLVWPAASRADIVILNDGKRMEGNILSESDDSIRMKYRITPKIWDEKTVLRSDIKEIIKQTPQEIEIVELRKIIPTADLMPAEKYEQIVQDRLRPFVNKYKGTPEAKEAEDIIKTLLEEKRKAVSGEVKVEGKWLTAEEAKLDRNNIEAYELLVAMQQKADEANYLEALREFDKLKNYTKLYVASPQFPKSIPVVLDVLDKYEAVIDRMISEQPVISQQREENLKKLIEPDLSRTKNAISAEVEAWKAQVDSEKRLRMMWMTTYKYDSRSLQDTKKKISFLRTELGTYDLEAIELQNAKLTEALKAMEAGDPATAEAAYLAAKEMQGNPSREFSRVMNAVLQKLNKAKTAARQKQFAQSTGFVPGATALAGTPGTTTDARVAQAMQQAQQNINQPPGVPPQQVPGAVPPAGAPPAGAPGAVPPQPGVPPQAVPGAAQGVPPTATPAGSIPPQQVPPPVAATPPPAGGSGNLQTLIFIGAGILVLILLITVLSQKKKA